MDEDPNDLLAELDLGGSRMRIAGRPPRSDLIHEYSRDLTTADIAALSQPRGVVHRPLARIHSSHHALARCLAAGMKMTQASLVTGYSYVRVQALGQDPAFQALVADYETEAKSVFADLGERMNNVSLDAIELLQERLQDKPEEFTVPMLLDVVKAFADRTGHGPGQDVNVRLTADLVDRPPRESFEDWEARRKIELEGSASADNVIQLPPPKAG